MKFLGHPVHMILIHFPAALFPMDFICSLLFYNTSNATFGYAAYYAMFGGTILGWLSVVTGAIDLISIKQGGAVISKALIHGTINMAVVTCYTVFTVILYSNYPNLPKPGLTLLVVKAGVNGLMIVGNYLGGNLVLKDKIGVLQHNTKTI